MAFEMFNNGAEAGAQLPLRQRRAGVGRPSAVWVSGGSRGWSSDPPHPAAWRFQPLPSSRASLAALRGEAGRASPALACVAVTAALVLTGGPSRSAQTLRLFPGVGGGSRATGRPREADVLPRQAGRRRASGGEAAAGSLSLVGPQHDHTEHWQRTDGKSCPHGPQSACPLPASS